jgi:hypothetical protein
MDKNWVAQNEQTGWVAIPRLQENPTRRDTIEAAYEIREYVGWGYHSYEDFSTLVRAIEPIRVSYYVGEAALEASEGEYESEFWREEETGSILAWCI